MHFAVQLILESLSKISFYLNATLLGVMDLKFASQNALYAFHISRRATTFIFKIPVMSLKEKFNYVFLYVSV